jgi:hypothetical protein
MTLQFIVNKQNLSLVPAQQNVKVASDSRNYLKANFTFQTSEWTRSTVHYALFTYAGKTYKRFLGVESGCKANECYVPADVIKKGNFTVSVFCGNLITSTTVSIPVVSSGYTEVVSDMESELLEKIENLLQQYVVKFDEIY